MGIIMIEEKTKKCPFCGEEILEVAIKCKHCKEDLVRNAIVENKSEQITADSFSRIFAAILLCGIFGTIGYFIGQYMPFTGGFLVSIAEPFSRVRDQVAYGYAVVGGVLGIILGLLSTHKKYHIYEKEQEKTKNLKPQIKESTAKHSNNDQSETEIWADAFEKVYAVDVKKKEEKELK